MVEAVLSKCQDSLLASRAELEGQMSDRGQLCADFDIIAENVTKTMDSASHLMRYSAQLSENAVTKRLTETQVNCPSVLGIENVKLIHNIRSCVCSEDNIHYDMV